LIAGSLSFFAGEKMFSETASKHITDISDKVIETNLFFRRAREGQVTKIQVANYAYNLQYVFHMTTLCLRRAHDRAAEKNQQELARFFVHKSGE